LQSNRKGISEFVKRTYLAYFKVMLGDQDKAWALHIVCKQCVEHLQQWTKKLGSHSVLVFQWSGMNRKIILMTATSVLSAQTESTGIFGLSKLQVSN